MLKAAVFIPLLLILMFHLSTMAIVTLTTDWGDQDFYAAAVKGRLLKALPELQIVDVCHKVEPHNIAQAAFILSNAYDEFPKGTVHIVSVNATASTQNPHVLVQLNGHYFIGADNGLLSLISESKPEKIIEIDIPQESSYFVFPARDIFVKAAVHLLQGKPALELGFESQSLKDVASWSSAIDKDPATGNDRITGRIIHVDNYGNCISNISETDFLKLKKNRAFYIDLPAHTIEQQRLHDAYDEVDEGKMLALMSSTGYLQIAVNQGRASQLLGLKPYESSIIVVFSDGL